MADDLVRSAEENSLPPSGVVNPQIEMRLPDSSLEASSDIVKALFGNWVGQCWGDFFCTHNRIRGRLYASSLAVLFYSNLLGFERRICLRFCEIVEMDIHRNTSIRILMFDGDTYVFRSFNDRVQVLHMLKGLKILADRRVGRSPLRSTSMGAVNRAASSSNEIGPPPSSSSSQRLDLASKPTAPPRAVASASLLLQSFEPPPPADSLSATAASVPLMTSNRRRAVSDSLVQSPQLDNTGYVDDRFDDESQYDDDRAAVNGDDSVEAAWIKAKEWNMPYSSNVGIDSLVVPISLEKFFQTFLADGAPYALDWYQRIHVGDRDIELTGWDVGDDGVLTRTMKFLHPIKNSFGVGPSEARTTRQQRLRRFRNLGIRLENTTVVEGIPSADAFYVQDHWLVEAFSEAEVVLSTRFGTRFTKRALFKSMIEKSIMKETTEWFSGYSEMVLDVLQGKTVETEEARKPVDKDLAGISELLQRMALSLDKAALLGAGLLICLSIILAMQLIIMWQMLALIQGEVRILREDVITILSIVKRETVDAA